MVDHKIAKGVMAVVVTYNRKVLLEKCLQAIKEQTLLPENIIVIDNASTDQSEKWIKNKPNLKYLSIIWHRLDTNEGGAGGFHEGIKEGIARKATYVWLMDDDGYPDQRCLEKLLGYASEDTYIGPLVLSKDDHFHLAFPLRIPGTLKTIETRDSPDLEGHYFFPNLISPFNGVLLPTKIVHKVGLPKKEFFLWGDEVEYSLRLKKAGISIGMVKNALFFHPTPPNVSTKMLFGLLRFNDPPSQIKLYCMVRNNVYTYKKYKGNVYLLAYILKTLYFYVFVSKDLRKIKTVLKATIDGLRRDFTKHQSFL